MEFSILHKSNRSLGMQNTSHSPEQMVEFFGDYAVYYQIKEFERITSKHWVFLWCGEHGTTPDINRITDLLSGSYLEEIWGLRGTLIALDTLNSKIFILNDSYGSFPVYYATSSNSEKFGISSRIHSIPKIDLDIDYTSVFEFIRYGYVIGESTLYRGIKRLNANSLLTVELSGSVAVKCSALNNFWIETSCYKSTMIDDIVDILREEATNLSNCQIMFSAGWDSRTVLAATLGEQPVAYTHGDLASREVKIVRDMCKASHIELITKDISDMNIDRDLTIDYLKNNESAMFLHWSNGGRFAKENNRILSAGTFGEVLGGHYGVLNKMEGIGKYTSLLQDILGFNTEKKLTRKASLEYVYNLLKSNVSGGSWIFNDDANGRIYSPDVIEESNLRLLCELERYANEGTQSVQGIFERFYTEHRGARYINLQPRNAISPTKIRNIYTNRDLVEISAQIPLMYRTHNKINKKCVQALSPKLLKFPMAATLVNAGSPLLFQEISRLVRKMLERYSALNKSTKPSSTGGFTNLGWNNFESLRNESYPSSMAALLSGSIWDIDAIKEKPQSDERLNMYSYLDMISKALTIDWIINDKHLK